MTTPVFDGPRFIKVVKKRWKLLFVPVIVSFFCVIAFNRYTFGHDADAPFNVLPNEYSAYATVFFDSAHTASGSVIGSAKMATISDLRKKRNIQLEVLMHNYYLARDVSEYLRPEYSITPGEIQNGSYYERSIVTDTIVNVGFRHKNRQTAIAAAKAFTIYLEKYYSDLILAKVGDKLEFSYKQMLNTERELAVLEKQMTEFEKEHNIVFIKVGEKIDTITKQNPVGKNEIWQIEFSSFVDNAAEEKIRDEYNKLLREQHLLETIYTKLLNQYEIARIEIVDETEAFTVAEWPELQVFISGPKRGLLTISVIGITLLCSVILTVIFEKYGHKGKFNG